MSKRKLPSLDSDIIDVTHLPTQKLADKTRKIISEIVNGTDYRMFRGKRLRHDRSIVSVPVNDDYRILCNCSSDGIMPYKVVSHENYNGTKPR